MILLSNCTITIQQENGEYQARATVGNHGREATTGSVIEAIGWAVLLAAGYTEAQLLQALQDERGNPMGAR